MTPLIRCRPLEWPGDREPLERLDVTLDADHGYRVVAAPHSFAIEATNVSPPQFKSYDFAWEELAQATVAIVAEGNASLLGVGAVLYHSWNRRAVISHLYVDRAVRGNGIGTRLVAELRGAAEDMGARCLWAETQNVNGAAIRFYESQGFVFCGLDTALYDPEVVQNETAVFFALQLGGDVAGRPPEARRAV